MAIRLLTPELVNQIAAGEVVERPASVVKELVENAIDAGATRVQIRTEGGGRDLIEVSDDGAGIPFGELALAVTAHATSKITSVDDLASIATLGFRGEALASIGSVARLEVISRPREQPEAGRIEVDGGRVTGPMPASGAPGTTVRVSTLFGHVPARRKFLKSESAEAGRITELLETMALAHPAVSFRLDHGPRRVLDLPAASNRRERVHALLGEELVPELLEVDARGGSGPSGVLAVWGVVARPSASKPTGRHQRIYVNGRAIVDRSLLHAVKEAFRGVIDPARFPVAVIQLEVDPAEVDVNVHPAKSEVRFRQPSAVHSFLLRAVRSALRAADLVPLFSLDSPPGEGVASADRREAAPQPESRGAWSGPRSSAVFERGYPDRAQTGAGRSPGFDYQSLERTLRAPEAPLRDAPAVANLGAPADSDYEAPALPTLLRADAVLQVHQSYLVQEVPGAILLIDQHALHERVLYEQLFERVMQGGLEQQLLLTPIMLECDTRAVERVESMAPLLARLGFDATPAGARTVAVHAVPSFLASRRVDAGAFLAELLGHDDLEHADLADLAGASEAAIHRIIDMMACKAAVKAGERLTDEEITRLLAARERVERSTNCPHGRPTSLRIPMHEIERRFGR
ncbi:MAG: DNA mismatch repair endonuclease MutL [Phycisphaeraceae bacterium]|nr:DNA mismatch repair endonuclease MutL [Phycisphaeraceae bacterium]